MAISAWRRWLSWAEVDRAVAFGVLTRAWGLLTGPVTILLIASYFSRELQGFHYTFYTLLALQALFELGLNQVIVQFASHEWSCLELDEGGRVFGDPEARSRLASIGRFAVAWYGAAAVLFSVGVAAAGIVFFSRAPQGPISWLAPWIVLCAVEALVLALLPFWALLEGCHQVAQVYTYRLGQSILSSLTVWTAIVLGAGLWTAPLASTVVLCWAARFLFLHYRSFFCSILLGQPSASRVSWRSEIWPLQWRLALSWMCGYLSFFLFTPVLFQYHGPAVAGQMGMTWSLVSALSATSTTWVLAKVPRFGSLIAARRYDELDRLALRLAIASFSVASAGALAILGALWVLHAWHFRLATRLLPPLDVALFLVATVLLQPPLVAVFYLRAHKREPMLVPSLISGVLIATSTVGLGIRYGSTGVAAGYLAVIALFSVPVTWVVWSRCRAEWHSADPASEPAGELVEA